jgi:hypothetical protein
MNYADTGFLVSLYLPEGAHGDSSERNQADQTAFGLDAFAEVGAAKRSEFRGFASSNNVVRS